MSNYNPKLALHFNFLLLMFMAGCGEVNPTRVNTILPVKTFGFTPTQQQSTELAPPEIPRPTPTLPPTSTTSATSTSQPATSATYTVAVDTPFPTPSTQSWVTVADTSANFHYCPSTTCAIVGEMSEGQQALAVGMLSDGGWIQIEYQDIIYWNSLGLRKIGSYFWRSSANCGGVAFPHTFLACNCTKGLCTSGPNQTAPWIPSGASNTANQRRLCAKW